MFQRTRAGHDGRALVLEEPVHVVVVQGADDKTAFGTRFWANLRKIFKSGAAELMVYLLRILMKIIAVTSDDRDLKLQLVRGFGRRDFAFDPVRQCPCETFIDKGDKRRWFQRFDERPSTRVVHARANRFIGVRATDLSRAFAIIEHDRAIEIRHALVRIGHGDAIARHGANRPPLGEALIAFGGPIRSRSRT